MSDDRLRNLYKFTTADRQSTRGSGRWRVNRWRSVRGVIVPCENGLHATTIDNTAPFIHEALWRVEVGDEYIWHTDALLGRKIVARRMRLIERIDAWDARMALLFAVDCAEHVLHVFERYFPDDKRPRRAIEVTHSFANGEASQVELNAARDAARDAAWAAAWAAARAAAWAAAGAAAWAAAGDAAWAAAGDAAGDAARAAECFWQSRRLAELLDLPWDMEEPDGQSSNPA